MKNSFNFLCERMKRLIGLAFMVLLSAPTMFSSSLTTISVNELPQVAQDFIVKYMADKRITIAKMNEGFFEDDYNVIFTDGTKVEFDGKGHWTLVKCKDVPLSIVPRPIINYIIRNIDDKDFFIVKLERDASGFHVHLSNGQELQFDKGFRIIIIND